ncbi:MAG: hypothetical protein H6Q92_1027 [Nitrospirae bacterium]|jgi:hypothetical protein|nr:hypothetical protein [Nitrospirota bacterium]
MSKAYLKIGNFSKNLSPPRKRGPLKALGYMDSRLRGNDDRVRTETVLNLLKYTICCLVYTYGI